MLVRPVDGRVHGNGPVDLAVGIGLSEQRRVDTVPDALRCIAAVPLPHGLPRSELLREVPPGNPAPVPARNAFYNLAVITERASALAIGAWQQRFNAGPLLIGKNLETRHQPRLINQSTPHLGDTP